MPSVGTLFSIDVYGRVLLSNSITIFWICKTFGGIWVQNFGKTREELRNMLEKYINLCTYNKYRHLLPYFSLNHG